MLSKSINKMLAKPILRNMKFGVLNMRAAAFSSKIFPNALEVGII